MRNAILILGALVISACSVDHLLVAALDDADGGSAGGMINHAGSSGESANAAGNVASGGSRSGGMDTIILISGGATSDLQIESDAGVDPNAATKVLCSCDGGQTSLCGTDGITYPTACEDGGTCFPPSVACLHACPCLAGESASGVTSWFSVDCDPTHQCAGGFICLMFRNASSEPSNCAPAGN